MDAPISVEDVLEQKYGLPHYIFLREVRDKTGFDSNSSADAMAISLYRTRGREILGFEVKRSRSDWLRELKDPGKAESLGKYCDHFFLITSDCSIAKVEEIPDMWGWMALKGSRMRVMKQGPKIDPAPLDRHILTSLLFRTMKKFTSDFDAALNKEIEKQAEEKYRQKLGYVKNAADELEKLEAKVREFEDKSGVHISYAHDIGKIGEAVNIVMRKKSILDGFLRDLGYVKGSLERISGQVNEELEALKVKTPNLETDT